MWLCKLGIHKWKKYQGHNKKVYTIYRKCKWCNKIQEHYDDSQGGCWSYPHWDYPVIPFADFEED